MTDTRIGLYVSRWRLSDSADLTLPHLTESVIDDEPVTRCGRRLRARKGTAFQYDGYRSRVCMRCAP